MWPFHHNCQVLSTTQNYRLSDVATFSSLLVVTCSLFGPSSLAWVENSSEHKLIHDLILIDQLMNRI